jgi:hippurate hydrolase
MHETLADLYRHLHAHPETAYKEFQTAALIAKRVRELGYEVTEGIGVTGVVALLRNGSGPTVLLRADMDALPMQERTGLPYASVDDTAMHACGHDMHVTWLIGALTTLYETRSEWSGTIMAVFQPAEEGGAGAIAMIDDGLFDRFGTPDVVLGQHVTALSAGVIGHRSGAFMAASDAFKVTLFGRGGHGSRPESTIDPVLMAASSVMRLHAIVSREVPATETAVLTVGAIHAGTAANIIAPEAELLITTRAFSSGVRQRVHEAMHRVLEAEAAGVRRTGVAQGGGDGLLPGTGQRRRRHSTHHGGHRCRARHGTAPGAAAHHGRGRLWRIWHRGRRAVVFLVRRWHRSVVFAAAEEAGRLDQDVPSNHSPFFAPVIEPTLSTGLAAMVAAAREWLD